MIQTVFLLQGYAMRQSHNLELMLSSLPHHYISFINKTQDLAWPQNLAHLEAMVVHFEAPNGMVERFEAPSAMVEQFEAPNGMVERALTQWFCHHSPMLSL